MHISALSVLSSLSFFSIARASVTVYGQIPYAASSASTSAGAAYTGAAAYDPTVLTPPALPNPLPNLQPGVQIGSSTSNTGGNYTLSIPQIGAFYGFSIEVSVVTQVLGLNSSFIMPTFLNLMANIKERAGAVHVRVGGNTQEYATVVPSLSDGKAMEKDKESVNNPTLTPTLYLTPEIFYMLGNISSLVNVNWYLGIPFNDTSNFRLQIAEISEAVLGPHLLGLQVGNEPDLYVSHGHRPDGYSQANYVAEFGQLITALNGDNAVPIRNNLIGPSVSGTWSPESVFDAGLVIDYGSNIGALSVEHYPTDNCYPEYKVGTYHDPQQEFPTYLTHTAGQTLVQPYLNSTNYAQSVGKPFLMFETNTASCGGFPGVSDSFGSALWALDYGLQMAYTNFSGAMLHVGGQNVYYNPFTPPPTNQSSYHQWTIGPVYYAVLVTAEALGPTGTAQVTDLNMNQNEFTPGYGIYENGKLAKLALFNYMDDLQTGSAAYTAVISIDGQAMGLPNGVPPQVKVKRLASSSVSNHANITWAGQTLGGVFESDGRLMGDLQVDMVTCDQNANTCQIKVPAPGFALVFFNDDVYNEVNTAAPLTFATTAWTKTINTATIAPGVLATSNGRGKTDEMGSTSREQNGAVIGTKLYISTGGMALAAMLLGALVIGRAL